jgi:hypothetical protein
MNTIQIDSTHTLHYELVNRFGGNRRGLRHAYLNDDRTGACERLSELEAIRLLGEHGVVVDG